MAVNSTENDLNNPENPQIPKQMISCENHGLNNLTFRQFELPHIHIENCISLYNTGLYEEPSAADSTNLIGFTNAFKRRNLFNDIFGTNGQKEQRKAVNKIVHLMPHKHSDIIHHTHCQKQAPQYPIRYFVGIRHSGHSISPHKRKWTAKHSGIEEVATETTKEYELPKSICFQPARLERWEDLEIHPLRACCATTKVRRKTNLERNLMQRVATIYLRRQAQTEEIPAEQSIDNKITNPASVETEYQELQPEKEMPHATIGDFVQFPEKFAAYPENGGSAEQQKFTAFLHICTKPQGREENVVKIHPKIIIEPVAGTPQLLHRMVEFKTSPIEDFVTLPKNLPIVEEKTKITAKIFVKSPEPPVENQSDLDANDKPKVSSVIISS